VRNEIKSVLSDPPVWITEWNFF